MTGPVATVLMKHFSLRTRFSQRMNDLLEKAAIAASNS